MVSPRALKSRPSVGSPTGTEMGLPVSIASAPRFSPSVGPRARHLTQLLPTCCSTSSTSFSPSISVSRALNMPGMDSEGNSTSTTVPITWVIFPLAILSPRRLLFYSVLLRAHGGRPAHDVQ